MRVCEGIARVMFLFRTTFAPTGPKENSPRRLLLPPPLLAYSAAGRRRMRLKSAVLSGWPPLPPQLVTTPAAKKKVGKKGEILVSSPGPRISKGWPITFANTRALRLGSGMSALRIFEGGETSPLLSLFPNPPPQPGRPQGDPAGGSNDN